MCVVRFFQLTVVQFCAVLVGKGDFNVGRDAGIGQTAALRRVVFADGQVQHGAVGERKSRLEIALADRLRSDLKDLDFVLLYAYNGTGKTRLSMEFKDRGKKGRGNKGDTLYFNAFTEDLFHWDNDLESDADRVLKINTDSNFFNGFRELALEEKIFEYLQRYATFNIKID